MDNDSFIRSQMTDDELDNFAANNAAEFKRLCRNDRLRKLAIPAYFLLLGFVIGFLAAGGPR